MSIIRQREKGEKYDVPRKETITILGGGISGITTAILLDLKGYNTELYAENIPNPPEPYSKDATSYVASYYPPASITPRPHSVGNSDEISNILENSWDFFDILWICGTMGIRKQTHYELSKAVEIDEFDFPQDFNSHNNIDEFEILLAQTPIYFSKLYEIYEKRGGNIFKQKLDRDEFLSLESDILVNCTGYNSREMFEDDSLYCLRGHLVYAHYEDFPRDKNDNIFSYSFRFNDRMVYSYPRNDYLVLGGSAQKGSPDYNDNWNGEKIDNIIEVGGIEVPEHIISVNRDILSDRDVRFYPERAGIGYRPRREGGPRIESEIIEGKHVIHNYGHGGAGVTLSWGSAFEVVKEVGDILQEDVYKKNLLDRLRFVFFD